MKNTKVKWDLRVSGYKDYITVDAYGSNGRIYGNVFHKTFSPDSPHFEQEYYDLKLKEAMLIAAAPDLLEALKDLLKDYQNLAGSPEFGDLPEVARAVEAIKKATA